MTTVTQDPTLPADVQAILDKNPQARNLGLSGRLPEVRLKDKPEQYIQGIYKSFAVRLVKGKERKFYAFAFEKSTAPIDQWNKETKAREAFNAKRGDLVEVMGSKIIDECVLGLEGHMILVTYLGEVKGKENTYSNFKVFDLGIQK